MGEKKMLYLALKTSNDGSAKFEVLLVDVAPWEPHDGPDFKNARAKPLFSAYHAGRAMNYLNAFREGWALPVLLWHDQPTDDRTEAFMLAGKLKALSDENDHAALFA